MVINNHQCLAGEEARLTDVASLIISCLVFFFYVFYSVFLCVFYSWLAGCLLGWAVRCGGNTLSYVDLFMVLSCLLRLWHCLV